MNRLSRGMDRGGHDIHLPIKIIGDHIGICQILWKIVWEHNSPKLPVTKW